MKSLCHNSVSSLLKTAALAIVVLLAAGTTVTAQQPARIQLSSLDHLAAKAKQTVDVDLDESIMKLTSKIFNSKDDDEARIKELVGGLKGIYVRVFEFEKEGDYSPADLESIRSQLRGTAWSKIVNVNSKKEGAVEVYLMTQGDQVLGLAVLAAGDKEIAVVNILGNIDLKKLSELEGHFGVPEDLGIEKPKRKN